jgi:predicted DNA-binding transcriptional regulator AlpA
MHNSYSSLIRMSELATVKDREGYLPLSPASVWRLAKSEGSKFPKPFKLGNRTTVWRISEIDEWVESKQKGDIK